MLGPAAPHLYHRRTADRGPGIRRVRSAAPPGPIQVRAGHHGVRRDPAAARDRVVLVGAESGADSYIRSSHACRSPKKQLCAYTSRTGSGRAPLGDRRELLDRPECTGSGPFAEAVGTDEQDSLTSSRVRASSSLSCEPIAAPPPRATGRCPRRSRRRPPSPGRRRRPPPRADRRAPPPPSTSGPAGRPLLHRRGDGSRRVPGRRPPRRPGPRGRVCPRRAGSGRVVGGTPSARGHGPAHENSCDPGRAAPGRVPALRSSTARTRTGTERPPRGV
jgi:hypothetical protein